MRLRRLVPMLSVAVAAVAAWVVIHDGGKPEDDKVTPAEPSVTRKPIGKVKPQAKDRAKSRNGKRGKRPRNAVVKRPAFDDLEGEGFSDAEKALAKKIGEALESDKFENVSACVLSASASSHPEIRSRMVAALQWFGKRALPELASFILDRDDDVRGEALDAWIEALQEFESPTAKRDTMLMTMKLINDSDAAEAMLAEIADMPNSYQIDILVELIENGNPVVVNAAKEQYEFLTDEEWSSASAAENWLNENSDDEIEVEEVIEKDAAAGVKTPVAQ